MTFLHGVEMIDIDSGARAIQTVRSSVIGLVGTAPDADANVFPLNTPVLVAGSRTEAAKLDTTGAGAGTLSDAMDAIFDHAGAVVAVIRVEEGADEQATLTNLVGGIDVATGQHRGVQALLAAESKIKVTPKILVVPGYAHQRPSGVSAINVSNGGTGYTSATVTIGGGAGAQATAVIEGGAITAINITRPGYGYDSATVTISGDGTGAAATATVAAAANPVVAELLGIADRLRAVIIADGPNTNDAAAKAYRQDWGSKRVYVVDPWVKVWDADAKNYADTPASARVAGIIAKSDDERGFWHSPSNRMIYGIGGTSRAVDFALGDANSRANLLNEKEVTTIIHQDGYRLWGNRTCSSDPKWAFLAHVRTHDMILESLQKAHLWAVDRNITRTYAEDVAEGVNAYLRKLTNDGAISGGRCWFDPDLNTKDTMDAGQAYFDFDYGRYGVAERVTFRARVNNDYTVEAIFGQGGN